MRLSLLLFLCSLVFLGQQTDWRALLQLSDEEVLRYLAGEEIASIRAGEAPSVHLTPHRKTVSDGSKAIEREEMHLPDLDEASVDHNEQNLHASPLQVLSHSPPNGFDLQHIRPATADGPRRRLSSDSETIGPETGQPVKESQRTTDTGPLEHVHLRLPRLNPLTIQDRQIILTEALHIIYARSKASTRKRFLMHPFRGLAITYDLLTEAYPTGAKRLYSLGNSLWLVRHGRNPVQFAHIQGGMSDASDDSVLYLWRTLASPAWPGTFFQLIGTIELDQRAADFVRRWPSFAGVSQFNVIIVGEDAIYDGSHLRAMSGRG